ncbi:MAG: hypothetical protein NBV65_12740 [Burkholderiaceae bacterium]|nr:hypothetical protein [Burkholderiaceae bacterium]
MRQRQEIQAVPREAGLIVFGGGFRFALPALRRPCDGRIMSPPP